MELSLNDIPLECMIIIFDYLNNHEVKHNRFINKQFYQCYLYYFREFKPTLYINSILKDVNPSCELKLNYVHLMELDNDGYCYLTRKTNYSRVRHGMIISLNYIIRVNIKTSDYDNLKTILTTRLKTVRRAHFTVSFYGIMVYNVTVKKCKSKCISLRCYKFKSLNKEFTDRLVNCIEKTKFIVLKPLEF